MNGAPAYGLWPLVVINSAVFIIFAFSFTKPHTTRDWRSFGAFSAFIVALFAEMYGFPLTIYVLSGWFGNLFPNLDPLSHDAGHLWYSLFGLEGNAHLNPIHLLSSLLLVAGFWILSSAWRVLYAAQRAGRLATTGPYARIRHPQYVGFILIMLGFLVQWPTLPTVLMFPVLVTMYMRLARREERDAHDASGRLWEEYAVTTPAFWPQRRRGRSQA
jgi:protein-S-isoprenylcysteine O-methyltransferase Ste14